MGSVSVKHVNTIQKGRRGGVGWGGVGWGGVGCGPAAVLQPRGAHKDPGSPQQHWLCQRMSVIRGLTEVILSSPRQCSGVPFCQRRSKRRWEEAREEQREEAARTRGGGVPFSARPYESSLPLSKNYNCTFLIFCALLLTVVID